MTAKVITDPGELADLIEGADRLMIRLGGENSFHKLPEPEAAMIVSALRKLCGEAEQSVVLATEKGLTTTGQKIAADERDAARYRWLRRATGGEWIRLNDIRLSQSMLSLDLSIDEARASSDDTEGKE